MATPIQWENANFTWNNNPHKWNEVLLVIEALGGGGVMVEDMPWTRFNDEKKKRLIKLICKVQGKTIKEEKEISNYKIQISDIKLLAKEVLGIEIMTENIKF
jgi:hypothetical protein|tara:strand:+ start:410 stop:715 length:306 start_codon:yes stop_codon:yes gene_type:complete